MHNKTGSALKLVRSIIVLALLPALFVPQAMAAGKTLVDSVIYGDYLVTMAGDDPVIENGAVAIEGNNIVAVGTRQSIDSRYNAKQKIEGKNKILMPGLVNGHTHTAMTLFRGMADDLKLMDWLTQYVFPMEGQFVEPDFIKVGTELACYEMIRGGITSFVDMYFYPDTIADVVERCGLRAIVGSPSIDFPSPGFKGWDDSFAAAKDFVQRRQGKHERITPAFAPHAPYTVSPEHIKQVVEAAHSLKAPISMHIAEAPSEIQIIKERYNTSPVKHVNELGLLNETLIAAHMVHPSEEEIQLLAGKRVGAIHNPTSNLKLAAGISPVNAMLEAGVPVGLGTDGAASNNDLDLWEEMRLAALVHKNREGDPTVLPALTALKMATSLGAVAVGLGDITGQLKPGMRADMIQVDISRPSLSPLYNVISHLVYMIDSSDVVTTMVSGKLLMKDQKILTLDGHKIRAAANRKGQAIAKALADRK